MPGDVPDGRDPVELAHWIFDRARAGETQRLAAYVEAGTPVNLTDAHGNTLLMLAAYHGHADAVRMLIEHGATVDAVNDRGQTPLAGAVFKGFQDVAETLIDFGADPRAGTPSAWDTATFFDRPDLLQVLRDRPAGRARPPGPGHPPDPDRPTGQGRSSEEPP